MFNPSEITFAIGCKMRKRSNMFFAWMCSIYQVIEPFLIDYNETPAQSYFIREELYFVSLIYFFFQMILALFSFF